MEVGRLLGLDGVREDKAYFLPRGFDSIASVSLSAINDDSFWFAYRRPKTLIDNEPLKSFLDRGYTIQARRELNAGPEIAVFVLLRR